MAGGTIKTVADLCTQADTDLPDNTQGLISPADVRNMVKDMIASGQAPFGGLHISASAETTIATIGVLVKAAGTTLFFPGSQFSMPTDNRLQYIGLLPNRTFQFQAALSVTAATNNQIMSFQMVKNGNVSDTESVTTLQQNFHSTGSNISSTTITGHFTLSQDDFIELFIANESSTGNLTVEKLNVTISGQFT